MKKIIYWKAETKTNQRERLGPTVSKLIDWRQFGFVLGACDVLVLSHCFTCSNVVSRCGLKASTNYTSLTGSPGSVELFLNVLGDSN